MRKLDSLRKKYPQFIYQRYSYKISKGNLEISFLFTVGPKIKFRPQITIKNIDKKRLGKIKINNFVFHLGLMEIPSYWKATCSPKIIIEAGYLNKEQINWWKDLIIKGMGQFFYENKIDWRSPKFLKIRSSGPDLLRLSLNRLKSRYLVPVGGGRDSIVTLERLKQQKKELSSFLVSPTKAAKKVVKIAGIKKPIVVERKIDPTLLKLNKKGYLNGHTPFTAVLSFLSVFCAVLFDYKNIAFSNEKSADEGNVKYLGRMINHQWAKSSEFERKFRKYYKKYLAKNINYFNYVRKYTELEISKMFTKYPKYFSTFSSCNVAGKVGPPASEFARRRSRAGDRWCGNCPKCLFVYATLYPFLEKKQLLKIFGRNIFENKKLLPIMRGLLEQGKPKPFECVGTKKESRLAFNLSLKKALRHRPTGEAQKLGKIPYLLTKIL